MTAEAYAEVWCDTELLGHYDNEPCKKVKTWGHLWTFMRQAYIAGFNKGQEIRSGDQRS